MRRAEARAQHQLRQRQKDQRHQRRQIAMNETDRLPDVVQERRRARRHREYDRDLEDRSASFVGGHARSYYWPSGSSCTIVIELARTGTMPVPSFNSGPVASLRPAAVTVALPGGTLSPAK